MKTRCSGCGVDLEFIVGPTDPYQCSTAACWATYNQLMAIDFAGTGYFAVHRLVNDTYMSQHPSNISRASIQSVWVHLVALYLTLEKQLPSYVVMRVMENITAPRQQFEWLTPPNPNLYKMTVKDLTFVDTIEEHLELSTKWAFEVWNKWNEHHSKIIQLANDILGKMK